MRKVAKTCLAAAALLAPLPAVAADAPTYMPRAAPPPGRVVAAPVYAAPACYAVFFMYEDGRGPSVVRQGPEDMAVMRQLAYPGGPTLNRNVMSVTTSPGAVVQLYGGRQFRRPIMKVGPESTVNLNRPRADSYTIDCVAPMPVAPPPGAFKY
jgi:hypothetical protein